jgi:spectinomycin phosphotransferase
VLAPPSKLDVDALGDVLRASWSSIAAPRLDYAPLGFGSHHWLTDDHFVTVDRVDDHDDLGAALRTAQALRDDAGLSFVVAPIAADDGQLLVPLGDEWLVHVYRRLEVVDDTSYGHHDSPEVLDLVAAVHEATPIAGEHARRETFAVDDRDDLDEALGELDEVWDTGPYGDRARLLLAAREDDVRRLLDAYDALVAAVPADGWVVTHGEPHRGNVFRTTEGWAMVDWDTALVAPRERDHWSVGGGTGDPDRMRLYRMKWDLNDIGVCTSVFFDDHDGDANDELSWSSLSHATDVRRRWPDLF